MLYSESHRFLFVHTPKTGGTSLRHHLRRHCNDQGRSLRSRAKRFWHGRDELDWQRLNFDRHAHLSLFQAETLGMPREVLTGYRIFAATRFPVAWHFSTYRHVLREHRSGAYARCYPERVLGTFEDYLRWRIDLGPIPQVAMVVDCGAVVRLTDFCRLERLSEEMPCMLNLVGLNYDGFPRLNAAGMASGTFRWSDEILSMCYDAYREDYETFGYDAEGSVLPKPDSCGAELPSLRPTIDVLAETVFDPWETYDLSTLRGGGVAWSGDAA